MNSQECKVSPEVFNVNSDEPVFFHFSAKTSKCRGSCNDKMIDMQNCVFLMLLKILISKFFI